MFPCRGPTPACARELEAWSSGLNLPGDRPHKADEFASDCRAYDGCLLALGAQRPVARGQAALSLPRDLADLRGGLFQAIEFLRAHTRRVTGSPMSALDVADAER